VNNRLSSCTTNNNLCLISNCNSEYFNVTIGNSTRTGKQLHSGTTAMCLRLLRPQDQAQRPWLINESSDIFS